VQIVCILSYHIVFTNETICPTLKRLFINMWFCASNFELCSSSRSSNNWIEYLQFCIIVFLLTCTLHLLIMNWFLWQDQSQVTFRLIKYLTSTFLFIWCLLVSRLSFIFSFIPWCVCGIFLCELGKEDKWYFYFNFVASLFLKKKFMENGCSSSLSLRNHWTCLFNYNFVASLLLKKFKKHRCFSKRSLWKMVVHHHFL